MGRLYYRNNLIAGHGVHAVSGAWFDYGLSGQSSECRKHAEAGREVKARKRHPLLPCPVQLHGGVNVAGERVASRRLRRVVAKHERRVHEGRIHAIDFQLRGRIARAPVMVAAHQQNAQSAVTRSPPRDGGESLYGTPLPCVNDIAKQNQAACSRAFEHGGHSGQIAGCRTSGDSYRRGSHCRRFSPVGVGYQQSFPPFPIRGAFR